MSAYIVDRATIHALVHAATWDQEGLYVYWGNPGRHEKYDSSNADALGEILTRANVASVSYRYPNDSPEDLPGRVDLEWASPYVYPLYDSMRWPKPDPGYVFAMLSCYEYQTCERPDWSESQAYAICDAIRRAWCKRVPGYDVAGWGTDTYPPKARP